MFLVKHERIKIFINFDFRDRKETRRVERNKLFINLLLQDRINKKKLLKHNNIYLSDISSNGIFFTDHKNM